MVTPGSERLRVLKMRNRKISPGMSNPDKFHKQI